MGLAISKLRELSKLKPNPRLLDAMTTKQSTFAKQKSSRENKRGEAKREVVPRHTPRRRGLHKNTVSITSQSAAMPDTQSACLKEIRAFSECMAKSPCVMGGSKPSECVTRQEIPDECQVRLFVSSVLVLFISLCSFGFVLLLLFTTKFPLNHSCVHPTINAEYNRTRTQLS